MPKSKPIKKVFKYVLAILRSIFWPYDEVFARNDDGEIIWIGKGKDKKPASNRVGTAIAKAGSLILAGVGTMEIAGVEVSKYLYVIVELL